MQDSSPTSEKDAQAVASAQKAEAAKYKDTLNLPQTAFKMKAGAATREVELEAYWDENRVYERMTQTRDRKHSFVLHDGPPYLSAAKIHIGTAMNKILKDIITRYKSQRGFYTPYVPGYDGHGLPIENAVVKTLKGGRHSITPLELRKRCRAFAMENLKGQESDFRRLGIWGHWEKPYVTIDAAFEATQIDAFGQMYEKGYVYKGLKPVYWCPHCETALADAEVEYDDHTSNSLFVKFKLLEPKVNVSFYGEGDGSMEQEKIERSIAEKLQRLFAEEDTYFAIWTTTPWTLPANLALAINPAFTYVLLDAGEHGRLIVAEKLLESFAAQTGLKLDSHSVLLSFQGAWLEHTIAQHPFIDRKSYVLLGDHVTLDAGTGIVHTAPGHGMEDYLVVQKYNRDEFRDNPLPILSPLDNGGKFTAEGSVKELEGVFYEKANPLVLDILRDKNALIHTSPFKHSYPHCWRCRNAVIYRATDQWFIDIDQFRKDALKAVDTVEWLPERGKNRIAGMVEGRGDWCLSRQRVWGVPIPVLYCAGSNCTEPFVTPATIGAIRKHFDVHSSDIWWEWEADAFLKDLPEKDRTCAKCGSQSFTKEMDIMDVWFDSGITHTAVVKARQDELGDLPVNLYLEGSDQHRGWFQSSLLTSVMLYGKAPYRSVLTHGFVLDEQGRKMSKSLGNVVDPHSIIREYGADVLRLWVASVDYTADVRIGKQTLHQLAEVYKKVRNTVRFIIGNLHDFDPARDRVETSGLSALDKHTLRRLRHIVGNVTDAFEKWEFYRYAHEVQYLCMADLSQLYFDVTKDILYCDAGDAPRRRAVQTVLYDVLAGLLPVLVPVMPHLAEDIWLSLPESQKMRVNGEVPLSATLLPWPEFPAPTPQDEADTESFNLLLTSREAVNAVLEGPRSEGRLGSSLEAMVALRPDTTAMNDALKSISSAELAALLIVSQATILTKDEPWDSLRKLQKAGLGGDWSVQSPPASNGLFEVAIDAMPASNAKCLRCWRYEPGVGEHAAHPLLCDRCTQAVS